MPAGTASAATPDQIARYGHIAVHLRRLVAERGWKAADLNEAVGQERKNTQAYQWLNSKGVPGKAAAAALAKITGLPVTEFQARDPEAPPPAPATNGAAGAAVAAPAARVANFEMLSDGTARISVMLTLPLADASALWVEITKRMPHGQAGT